MLRFSWLLLSLLALVGCFDAPSPDCAFLCGPGETCPDGYFCSSGDNWCKRNGLATDFSCDSDAGTAELETIPTGLR